MQLHREPKVYSYNGDSNRTSPPLLLLLMLMTIDNDNDSYNALWARITKNPEVSAGPLGRSLAPLTRGKVNY